VSGSLGDPAMLELFHAEVETHVTSLNSGLLSLEKASSDPVQLEALMRAAHSIKGAARIVRIEPAVTLAHAMEDVFVAAQQGTVELKPDHVDVLLKSTDLLERIGGLVRAGKGDELTAITDEADSLATAIRALKSGQTASPATSSNVTTPPVCSPRKRQAGDASPALSTTAPSQTPKTSTDESAGQESVAVVSPEDSVSDVVRVSARNLESLMELSGEATVRVKWLASFVDSLREFKNVHASFSTDMDHLAGLLPVTEHKEPAHVIAEMQKKLHEYRSQLMAKSDELAEFGLRFESLSDRLYSESIAARMRPFSDGVQGFPRMVRDLVRKLGKEARLDIVGEQTAVDRDVLEKLEAPVTHLLRNALDHGIESPEQRMAVGKLQEGTLTLQARHHAGMLSITVSDDGRGVDVEELRQKVVAKGHADATTASKLTHDELLEFLFLPGFTTTRQVTELSGRGVGLDIVHDMVHKIDGRVTIESRTGEGTQVHMLLPITLSVVRVLLVEVGGEPYAIRLAQIERCLKLSYSDIVTVQDRWYVSYASQNIGLVEMCGLLGLPSSPNDAATDSVPGQKVADATNDASIVLVSEHGNTFGLLVDRFLGQTDLVVRPLDARLGPVPCVSAAGITEDGSPTLVLAVDDMVRAVEARISGGREGSQSGSDSTPHQKRVLVVDDSRTVREAVRRLLEKHGYHVELALDGADGWHALTLSQYDLMITDVDMPRMDGLELTATVRASDDLKTLPIVMFSYKDGVEDRERGLAAGADRYVTKSGIHDDTLVRAIVDLIPEPDGIKP
jgi:two-component system, chemotaxis family, sensor histidine kinase and response regulator WspE